MMVRKILAKFSNGVFWEQYCDLEREFRRFLEYVPYLDQNKSLVSFGLGRLILGIGGHIDSAFKEMVRYESFSRTKQCMKIMEMARNRKSSFALCLGFFEDKYRLSNKVVVFKRLPEREDIIPFKPRDSTHRIPEWWDVYNDLKHEFSRNFDKATLENARNALAAAFLLNVRHISGAVRLCEYGVMKTELRTPKGQIKNTFTPPTPATLEEILREGKGIGGVYVETALFLYDYVQ